MTDGDYVRYEDHVAALKERAGFAKDYAAAVSDHAVALERIRALVNRITECVKMVEEHCPCGALDRLTGKAPR